MADDLNPHEIRERKFGVSRRGYDRSEVTEFLGRVADRVRSAENDLATVEERLGQLGITDLPSFKHEIDDLGAEITAVLAAAMTAAEGLRSRAHADSAAMLAEADDASTAARTDAWTSGTELLQQAEDAAARMLAEAREDALFVRAEAEQDAKRLVTDARRQADEMIRSSREEGEKIVVIAKAESEAILEGARQSADKAQERARALENRRSELLGELEAAESAMRDLEASKTKAATGPAVGAKVTADGRTHWAEDEGTIRILPAAAPEPVQDAPAVVDAEEMAAEVAEMRSAVAMPEETETLEIDIRDESVGANAADAEPADIVEAPPQTAIVAKPGPAVESAPQPEAIVEAAADGPAEPAGVASPEPAAEPAAVEEKVTVMDGDPGIAALFARLRNPGDPAAAAQIEEPAPAESVPAEPEPVPALQVVPDLEVGEGFDRRDRLLLPIENTGLRGLKRRIVELQNRVLEELRTSGGEYRLGREFVVAMMGDELDEVLGDSYRVGHAAAAESLGVAEPQLTGGPNQGAAESFSVDLHSDVQEAIARSSAGTRKLSSDVSRVFRGWRTDEAERHVRTAARRAFNDGLLAGYKRLGLAEVELAAPGRCCGECAADNGESWAPVDEAPPGVDLPPLRASCSAMVVPKGSSGFDSRPEQ
jgi:DivIVA domain-containing protein